ncbi:MAG: lysine--tRNA ligase [Candidatus Caldarchaeum sp.]|nr:lysine--tRNA ligase [Candidatus Caldarchaeum sp.]
MGERRQIGLGTWLDKLAWDIVERERKLGRSLDNIVTEAGIAASGFVHIGSLSDSVRAYAVSLALKNLGYRSEMIQFADDMDGLRSVPAEIPKEYEKHLLEPVSLIPDPFSCHESYAEHMEYLLLDALAKLGVEAKFYRGYEIYRQGRLKKEIFAILSNWEAVGMKIAELTGQEKFKSMLPYFPLCASCGKIYTTHADGFDPKTQRVHYVCKGVSIKKRWFEGCGYEGEAEISKADGKLSWKVEWAARWAGLDVRFEAYGKDLAASVKVNDWVCENILKTPAPFHVQYELFLDASKRKISKSRGVSVFTPAEWLKYGSPQSLVLLFLKRIKGTRVISPNLIPSLMNELDQLADQYHRSQGDVRRTGLYAYAYLLNPPARKTSSAPYNLLLFLASVAPVGKEADFIHSRLVKYGYTVDEETSKRVEMAINFYKTFGKPSIEPVQLDEPLRTAVEEVAEAVINSPTPESLQAKVFETARKHGIKPSDLFQTLYRILIGHPSGPRFASFVFDDMGVQRAYSLLKEAVSQNLNMSKTSEGYRSKSEEGN